MWRRQVGALLRARCSCHVSSVHCRVFSVLRPVGLRGSGDWKRPDAIVHLTFQFDCHHVRIVSFLSKPRDLICLVLCANTRWVFLKRWSHSIPPSAPARTLEMIITHGTSSVNQSCYCLAAGPAESLWPQWKVNFLGCS